MVKQLTHTQYPTNTHERKHKQDRLNVYTKCVINATHTGPTNQTNNDEPQMAAFTAQQKDATEYAPFFRTKPS